MNELVYVWQHNNIIDDEMRIAVWMVTNQVVQRKYDMERRYAAKIHMYCALVLRLLQQNYEERSLYCQARVSYDSYFGALLRGEPNSTKEHLRVPANIVYRLVELCRQVHKRSGWCIEIKVNLSFDWT